LANLIAFGSATCACRASFVTHAASGLRIASKSSDQTKFLSDSKSAASDKSLYVLAKSRNETPKCFVNNKYWFWAEKEQIVIDSG
jgi:hypothetical protein